RWATRATTSACAPSSTIHSPRGRDGPPGPSEKGRTARRAVPAGLLVAEADAERLRRPHDVTVGGHEALLPDDLGERHRPDVRRVERDHAVVLSPAQELDGHRAEPRGEHAVEARGRAAALQVAEHHRTRFLTGQLLELGRDPMPDAAEPL